MLLVGNTNLTAKIVLMNCFSAKTDSFYRRFNEWNKIRNCFNLTYFCCVKSLAI